MGVNIIQKENFIQDFVEVTSEVLSTMASLKVQAKNVHEINGNADSNAVTTCMDITGILGFLGNRRGSILITFPRAVACRVVGGMLGIEFNEVDADVRDGISELVNMIAGGAKTRLQNKGVSFELSIPNTIVGPNHQITAPTSITRTHIDFATAPGNFFVEVYLKDV
ncbi:MAG: chemotaxis protein CheX [bacterium]